MTADDQDRNRRVLVIDDMSEIHTVFRKVLGRKRRQPDLKQLEASLFGTPAVDVEPVFEVECASQGEAGLDMVRAALAEGRPYAVAFVDMRMPPGWDGVQTIQAIWAEDPDVEIVICSAYSDYSDHELAARLGATDQMLFLRKPFESIEARQLARALTEQWALRQQSRLRMAALERNVATRTRELTALNLRIVDDAHHNAEIIAELDSALQVDTLGRLTAGVAHELDASLALLTSTLTDASAPAAIARALETTRHMSGLVTGMLKLAARQPPTRETIDLNVAISDVVEVLREGIAGCGTLTTELGVLPPVPCIPAEIDLVLFGLLDNAVHAAEDAKLKVGRAAHISISTRSEDGYGVVAISDTGEPVPDALKARIFEPFCSGDRPGLAYAWEIVVDHHGGKLAVEPSAGGGSTVYVRLPLSDAISASFPSTPDTQS